MRTSIFAFATDLEDEGLATVLDNVQQRAGLDALTLAVAYHDARDLFPHNPVRKVRFLEPGVVFFRPERGRYGSIHPRPSVLAEHGDPLAELCEAAALRGLDVNAWAVFLHSDRLGFEHPECAPRNAFGDPYLTDLCPAHPDVREYARALAGDVARYPVQAIRAESLQFHGLEHGYHHERYFEELGADALYLLGLCFCEHCRTAARDRGVDADGLRRHVRDGLERAFAGEGAPSPEPTEQRIGALFGGEMRGYLEARAGTVTSLAAEVAAAARASGVRLTVMDMSGAENGFATGKPCGEPAPASAWRSGVRPAELRAAGGELQAIGYAADPDRLRLDLEAYRALVPGAAGLAVALRPMPPDCRSPENLAAKVALVRELEIGQLDFYHYGLCRLRSLDWISSALTP